MSASSSVCASRVSAIRAVGFTGSTAGGRALFDLACARPDPIPFYGELGSLNPVVVLPGAARQRPEEIAAGYATSLTLGVGQFCTNPGLLFVPSEPRLLQCLGEAVGTARGGTMLTAGIAAAFDKAIADAPWRDLDLVGQGEVGGARPEARSVRLAEFSADAGRLGQERFGPAGLVVVYDRIGALLEVLAGLGGNLTATVHAAAEDNADAGRVADVLEPLVGRLVFNDWPTGVAVSWAMHHGGPWPATTASIHTSVGATAIRRWLSPIAYQNWPDELLPPQLQNANPLGIPRREQ
jgi:NADP-dependent aldehyde dehydrogenase